MSEENSKAQYGEIGMIVDCLVGLTKDDAPIGPETFERPEAPGVPSAKRGRILLAEDNGINTMLAVSMLQSAGYAVEHVGNGAEALEAARSGRFDLILMDIQMPEMDGLEATRLIRKLDGEAGAVPIMAMTALSLPSDRDACIAAGMNDYISKPIDLATFLGMVARNLTP
jgi:CheY-like chemotaxis protein